MKNSLILCDDFFFFIESEKDIKIFLFHFNTLTENFLVKLENEPT